jgi:hypothetical protein
MATAVTTLGKYELFKYGWTLHTAWVRLYTSADVLVDEQSLTLSYASNTLSPSATIVFDVASGTNDVSYVVIGYTTGTPLDVTFYTKDLPALYDFPSDGTLTVNSWQITVGGTYLLPAGRDDLCVNGWESLVTWVKLYNSSDVLLASESMTFAANVGTGVFAATSDIVFEVATGGAAYYAVFGYTSGSDVQLYKRLFSTTYTFTTAGRLTIDSWEITI